MKSKVVFPVLVSFLLFSAPSINQSPVSSLQGKKQPNVLFLVADDLAIRLGCYGDKAAHTPALDRLASEGVMFERAYAAGTVCTPSRKSFITGLHVKTIGWGNNNYLRDNPETMTLPRWFREHGYHTAKIGKIAHTDDYEGLYDWDENLNLTETFPVGKGNVNYLYGSSAVDDKPVMLTRIYPDDEPTQDKARTEVMERFIAQKWDRSKPFFLALGFHTPHQPNDANQKYFDELPVNLMPLTIAPEGATPMTKPFPSSFRYWSIDFPDDEQRKAIQGYYAAVTMMDDCIGRIMGFLTKEKLMDNTIIVFTADQGYNLGYRYIWAKHVLYPSVLRVPLIVKYPGMPKKGARVQGLVELLDIFPTLTALAGLPQPGGLDGTSFVPLMENPAAEGKEAAYAQGILHDGSGISVTTKDATYMEWDNGIYREFYDLSKDPDAWFNQVSNPDYKETLERHKKLLHEHFNK